MEKYDLQSCAVCGKKLPDNRIAFCDGFIISKVPPDCDGEEEIAIICSKCGDKVLIKREEIYKNKIK